MTSETIKHLFKILIFAVPVFNVLVMALWIYGAIRSPRFRAGFVLMAFASAFCAFPQLIQGILQAQQDWGAEWLSKDIVLNLFPLVTISYWAVMPSNILGGVVIIRQAMKLNEQSRNPNE